MKTSAFFKVGALIALGVCSLIVTRSLIAQNRKPTPRAAAAGANHQVVGAAGRDAMTRTRRIGAHPGPDDPRYADVTIDARDGVLDISAAMNLLLTREPYCSYMWHVAIADAKTQARVHELNYVDQMFELEPGVLRKVTFHDRFEVGPGEYTLCVGVFRVRPGADPDKVATAPDCMENIILTSKKL